MILSLDGKRKVWEPLPRQQVALSCPAFELLYGGQKGGGKTDVLAVAPVPLLSRAHDIWKTTGRPQPRCRGVIFRKNLSDLTDIISRTMELYPVLDPKMGIDGWNKNSRTWTFSSGAFLELRHLDGPEDHKGYNGQELRFVGMDQAEEIPEEVAMFLIGQIRTSDPAYRDLLMFRATANPGGRHGDWVYKRYIAPHPAGNKILYTEVTNRDGTVQKVSRAFIPATLADNKYLNEGGQYEAQLRAALPEHMIKQYLEGDWNVVIGAHFAHMIGAQHGMSTEDFLARYPRGVPPGWDVGFGLDWGSAAPAATIFCARDEDDRIWGIDEVYTPGKTGRTYGERLVKHLSNQKWSLDRKWKPDDFYGNVDKQAWDQYGADGASAGAGIASFGFRLFEAQKDRNSGCEQIRERLLIRPDGLPGLVILKERCPVLWRTLRTIRTDPKDPETYDMHDEAHAVDALRFKLMDWPVSLYGAKDAVDEQAQRWERYLSKARERQNQLADDDDIYSIQKGYGS